MIKTTVNLPSIRFCPIDLIPEVIDCWVDDWSAKKQRLYAHDFSGCGKPGEHFRFKADLLRHLPAELRPHLYAMQIASVRLAREGLKADRRLYACHIDNRTWQLGYDPFAFWGWYRRNVSCLTGDTVRLYPRPLSTLHIPDSPYGFRSAMSHCRYIGNPGYVTLQPLRALQRFRAEGKIPE